MVPLISRTMHELYHHLPRSAYQSPLYIYKLCYCHTPVRIIDQSRFNEYNKELIQPYKIVSVNQLSSSLVNHNHVWIEQNPIKHNDKFLFYRVCLSFFFLFDFEAMSYVKISISSVLMTFSIFFFRRRRRNLYHQRTQINCYTIN